MAPSRLDARGAALVRNATCAEAGHWSFPGLAEEDRPLCPFPFAPNLLARGAFAGGNDRRCDTTYGDLLWPHQTAAGCAYGAASLALAALYLSFHQHMEAQRTPAMRAGKTTNSMQKVYAFNFLSALFSAAANVDVRGFRGNLPPWAYQAFVELSGAMLHCALFVLMVGVAMAERVRIPGRAPAAPRAPLHAPLKRPAQAR